MILDRSWKPKLLPDAHVPLVAVSADAIVCKLGGNLSVFAPLEEVLVISSDSKRFDRQKIWCTVGRSLRRENSGLLNTESSKRKRSGVRGKETAKLPRGQQMHTCLL